MVLLRQLAQRWNIVLALPIEHSSPLSEEEVCMLKRSGGRLRAKVHDMLPQEEEDHASLNLWPEWMDTGTWSADIYGTGFLSHLGPNVIGEPLEWNFNELLSQQ